MKHKKCTNCLVKKLLTEFHKSGTGYKSRCKVCRSKIAKQYGQKPKTKHIKRINALKNNYGITFDEYNVLFTKQNGKCAICDIHQSKLKRLLCVDHCHKKGNIRGLLCKDCNVKLAPIENEEFFKKAIKYLEE